MFKVLSDSKALSVSNTLPYQCLRLSDFKAMSVSKTLPVIKAVSDSKPLSVSKDAIGVYVQSISKHRSVFNALSLSKEYVSVSKELNLLCVVEKHIFTSH